MNRRNFIVGAAGATTASALGLAAFTGGAAAELEDYELSSSKITGATDDGSLEGVTLEGTNFAFSYEGLENEAEFAVILLSSGDESKSIIDSEVVTVSGTRGDGEAESTFTGDITQLSDYDVSDFEVDSDGGETAEDVPTQLDTVVFSNTDDAVDAGTIEGYINAGADLQNGIDQLENNDQYYDFVRDTKTTTVRVEMTNIEAATSNGGQVSGDVVTE